MATVQRFEGPSLDDVLAQVRLALGDDAEIIEANRIKASGVIGSDRYEVKARRAQKGQRRADREAANAHVNPHQTGAGASASAGAGEPFPGGLDDATVQAAMDHVQQVMADLERKRIVQDHADAPSPTSLVDLADQVVDDSPELPFSQPELGSDPGFATLLAEARANARANAPSIAMEWPELDAMSSAKQAEDDAANAGTVEWEPLDWSARRVRTTSPEDIPAHLDLDEADQADQVVQADAYDDIAAGMAAEMAVDEAADEAVDEDDFGPVITAEDPEDEPVVEQAEAPAEEPTDELMALFEEPIDEEPIDEDTADTDEAITDAVEVIVDDTTEDDTAEDDAAEDIAADDAAEEGDVEEGDVEDAEATEPAAEEPVVVEETDEAVEVEEFVEAEPAEEPEAGVTEEVAKAEQAGEPCEDLDAEPAASSADLLPSDEDSETAQTGWVDADREFMGVWTDEAEHEDAGWFATGEPDDEAQEFATLRNHRLVEWLSRNDLTPEALSQALEGLPRPDDLPPGPGVIIAVVGEGPMVLPLARRIAVDLGADPAKVVLASESRSHASVPDNCRISNPDEAALDRRAWRRRNSATLVAVDTSASLAANAQDWAYQVLESLQPHQVIALVDAGRKAEDVARWVADLGGIDAIALSGLEETVSPHAILELGIPVARLGTQVATPRAWSALLRNRREPAE